ncbi:MAG: hypothetical protein NPIRA01_34660 [Nitrospirales bacterium]|nr:MAG: hypothetical protein NPIRA01_34660 [Nitrospirales bacterium]
MNRKTKTQLHYGRSEQNQPQLLLEYLSAAVAAGEFGKTAIEISKNLKNAWPQADKLETFVINSSLVNEHHFVSMKFFNPSDHGAYIETFKITIPLKLSPKEVGIYHDERKPKIDFSDRKKVNNLEFPRYLEPYKNITLTCCFPKQTGTQYTNNPYGAATYTYSMLNQKKEKEDEVTFRLRW